MGLLKKKKCMDEGGPIEPSDDYDKFKKALGLAEGGSINSAKQRKYQEKGVHQEMVPWKRGQSAAGALNAIGDKESAKTAHQLKLEELKSMPKPKLLAHGGEADYQSSCTSDCNSPCEVHEMGEDLVGQVLAKRMSEGGKVANSDEPIADSMPNEFDYLHLSDGLEDNSSAGNEHGDTSLFEDTVSKVMLKRRKQHNPRPA